MHTSSFRVLFALTRFPVSVAVTFTAFTAMIIKAGAITLPLWLSLLGIFLLASGASALNQYQEWPYDERMDRTRKRPVPSRRISTAEALRIATICIVGGMAIPLSNAPPVCFLLGFFNLIWYNGIYTYLKRKTAFAVVPGALTGVIPIFMGWSAAGGELNAPHVLFLAFFLFIWQMPHFWLLTMKYGKEYRMAGFPVLSDYFGVKQVKIVTMTWIIASSATSFMFVFFGILHFQLLWFGIILLNIVMLLVIAWQLFFAASPHYRLIFAVANLFMLAVMLSLIVDRLITQ